ncbi:MAG: C40 family peptidase [Bacteroidia bacterium]|nr:C40 family peptidase [Bacteroidia bacterium]
MNKGTCLVPFLPMRSKPHSDAEMVNSILFGESYEVINEDNDWLFVRVDLDAYEGWISKAGYSVFIDFNQLVDALYLEAASNGAKFFIPCGGKIPENGKFIIDGQSYAIIQKVKTNHHLPLRLRILNTAKSFLNAPYLWGGRSFMGIDCSGLVQVVYKVNGFDLPRDTAAQISTGTLVNYSEHAPCDLVFFSRINTEKVVHVGIVIDNKKVIHAGARVRINELTEEGLIVDGQLAYKTIAIKRII